MVGTSKSLTVSYGTFSCTLEGFDDPFSKMKTIAEYFRDLAAADRFFGADPTTPDANTLAQIAESDISRRADANTGNEGIHSRAAAPVEQSANPDKAARARHGGGKRSDVDAAPKTSKSKAKTAAKTKEKPQSGAKTAQGPDDAPKTSIKDRADDSPPKIGSGRDKNSGSVKTAQASKSLGAIGPKTGKKRDAATGATPDVHSKNDPPPAKNAAQAARPDNKNLSSKQQPTRAVVDISDQPKTVEADDMTGSRTDDGFAAMLTLSNAERGSGVDDSGIEPDALSRVMARHRKTQGAGVPVDTPPLTEQVDAKQGNADQNDAQQQARVIRMKRTDLEKIKAEQARASAPKKKVQPSKNGPDLGLLDGAGDLDEYLEDSDFADDAPIGNDATFFGDPAENRSRRDAGSQDGSARNAQSKTSGAAAVATGQTSDTDDGIDASSAVKRHVKNDGKSMISDTSQVDDAALDRLLSETDAQMREPDGSRRRDAIAQLKAAVAAKEAARQVGDTDKAGKVIETAFRNDLSQVTQTEGGRARAVQRPLSMPLKLVPAQRVDLDPVEKQRDPFVPGPENTDAGGKPAKTVGSFGAFVDVMGASDLPDLVEAAAAYTAFVEGAGEFSRPQIMRRVRAAASDDFKREDGLRSFADLLRSGRFTKVRNGRFQIADDSRFNPRRRAG